MKNILTERRFYNDFVLLFVFFFHIEIRIVMKLPWNTKYNLCFSKFFFIYDSLKIYMQKDVRLVIYSANVV